jgi:hypothetical protein
MVLLMVSLGLVLTCPLGVPLPLLLYLRGDEVTRKLTKSLQHDSN